MWEMLINNWPFAFIVAAVLFAWLAGKLMLSQERFPYEKRSSLLTEAELAFYRTLTEAVDDDWAVQAMVRMADLIRVRPQTPKFQSWQNRIHAKHIDFLLCHRKTMEACLAVELDDATHGRADRIARDRFVNQALSDAGLPLLRVPVGKDYDAEQLRDQIDQHVARGRSVKRTKSSKRKSR